MSGNEKDFDDEDFNSEPMTEVKNAEKHNDSTGSFERSEPPKAKGNKRKDQVVVYDERLSL